MAENKTIFTVDIDVAKSAKTLKELKDLVNATNKEFHDAAIGSEEYQKLEVQLATTKAEYKRLFDATKAAEQALGGVNTSAKFAAGSYGDLKQQIVAAKKEVLNSVIGTDKAAQAEKTLNGLLQQEIDLRSKQPSLLAKRIAQGVQEATSIKDLKQQLIFYREEAIKAGENTPIGQEFLKKASEAKDRIGDLNAAITAMSSDTANFDAVVQGARGVASGFAVAQGAAALFGDENKDLQKQLVKIQASIAVLNGLTEIQNVLNKDSIFKIKALSVAQSLYSVVVGTSTGAMKAFRIALALTGVGALVLGLIALITNFKEVKQKTEDFIDSLGIFGVGIQIALAPVILLYKGITALGQALGLLATEEQENASKNIKSQTDVIAIIGDRYDREIKLAQAAGKDTVKLEQQKLIAQTNVMKSQLANFETIAKGAKGLNDEQKKQQEELKKSVLDNQTEITAIFISEGEKRKDIATANERQISSLRIASIKDERKRAIAEVNASLNQTLADKRKSSSLTSALEAELTADAGRKISKINKDFALKAVQEEQAVKILETKKGTEERIQAEITAINAIAQATIANTQTTEDQRKSILLTADQAVADKQGELLDLRVNKHLAANQKILDAEAEGSQKRIALEIEAQEKAKQIVQQDNTLDPEVKFAKEKAIQDKINALKSEGIAKELELLKLITEGEALTFETALLMAKDGSKEQLTLRKGLAAARLQIAKLELDKELEILELKAKTAGGLNEVEAQQYANYLKEKQALDAAYNAEFNNGQKQKEEIEKAAQDASIEAAGETAHAIVDAWLEAQQRRTDAELERVANQRDAEISALDEAQAREEGTFVEKTAIQKKYDAQREAARVRAAAQEAKIKKEQAKKDKTAALIQAAISTALAVIKAAPAIPLMIAAGIAGAASIALIAAQPLAYEKGGFTGLHTGGKIKGGKQLAWVNEKGTEWVAPNHFLTNPVTAPLIEGLENYRKGKALAFADGGFTANYVASPADTRSDSNKQLLDAISRLPRPVVDVEQVTSKQALVAEIKDSATF